MKTLVTMLLVFFVLSAIASAVKAADMSDSKCYEQPEREIPTQ
jgi:hypothetical protein